MPALIACLLPAYISSKENKGGNSSTTYRSNNGNGSRVYSYLYIYTPTILFNTTPTAIDDKLYFPWMSMERSMELLITQWSFRGNSMELSMDTNSKSIVHENVTNKNWCEHEIK